MFACNKTGPFCLLLLDYPVFTLSYLTSFHLLAAKFFSLISPKKNFSLVFLLNCAGFSFIFLKTTVFRFLRPNYALVGLFASRAHFRMFVANCPVFLLYLTESNVFALLSHNYAVFAL